MSKLITYQPEYKQQLSQLIIELQDYELYYSSERASGLTIAEEYLEELVAQAASYSGEIVLALEDAIAIGFIAYTIQKDTINNASHVYISDLVVTQKYRARGIAKELMSYVENTATNKNITSIRVGALENSPSADFYKRLGYEVEVLQFLKKI